MSLFSRAIAGAAEAGSRVLNKFIDDDIIKSRAQVLADIQRTSAVQTDADLDAQRNAPERLARDRAAKVDDIRAVGTAQNEVSLSGKRAEATDTELTAGLVGRAKATAQAGADVQFDAQKRALTELGGLEVELAGKKARATAEATYSTQAKYREKPAGSLSPAEKMGQIEDAIGRPLKQEEKEALAGLGKTGTDPLKKIVEDATSKALETGTIQPEQAGEYASKIRQGFTNVAIASQMGPVVTKARQGNDIGSLVDELKQQGFSVDQIKGFGITDQEMKGQTKKVGDKRAPSEPEPTNALPGTPNRGQLMDRAEQLAAERRAAKPAPQDRSGDALRQEAAALTIEDIRSMAPDEAQRAYSRFQGVLQGDLLTALRRRM